MSEESTTADLVELTRRQFEAGSRRDLDAVLSFYAPDAVWEAVSLGTLVARVTASSWGIDEGRAAAERFAESRG